MQKVNFFFEYKRFVLRNRLRLKGFIREIFEKENRDFQQLNVIFCDDKILGKINCDFLQHTTYTDIITFELSTGSEAINAEIYISIDRIKENAGKYNSAFTEELHRVIFHGILHLCGYKDKSKKDKEVIRNKENFYLSGYLPN